MSQHEILAAAMFIALSFALIGIFSLLERQYKRQLTGRRKI
jgi:hypothetical protein